MREIKFRAWDERSKEMFYQEVGHPNYKILSRQSCNSDIIMQYTGLKDKKRKEIYEGDIIERHKEIKVVEWIGGDSKDFQGFDIDNVFGGWKVIGNIYENKELLK